MALPPTIPTSFVPHEASTSARRFRADYSGAFSFFAYAVLAIVLALAVGVFLYGRILVATQSAKDAELTKAEAGVDPSTVESFIRLHNRLASGETLLGNHIAFSGFFTLLQTIMPATVRFSSLHLWFDNTGTANVEGTGVAKSFNALAAASADFAADGGIKNAIFSNIVVSSKNNAVSFALAATLDPKLIAFSPSASAPAAAIPASGLPQGSSASTTLP